MQKIDLKQGVLLTDLPSKFEQMKSLYWQHFKETGEYPAYVRISPEDLVEVIRESGGLMFVMDPARNPKEQELHVVNFILDDGQSTDGRGPEKVEETPKAEVLSDG